MEVKRDLKGMQLKEFCREFVAIAFKKYFPVHKILNDMEYRGRRYSTLLEYIVYKAI